MKQLIGVVTLGCAVSVASLVAQTPASAGHGTPASGGAKPQSAKPATGGNAPATADATFVRTAAMDGMAEIEHGRLAAQNASHDEVKQFAQRMVDDHGKAGDELKGLASQKNITLPTELDAKHKAMQDKLSKMKAAAFDRAYMAHMVTAHQQAVGLFQKEASGGKDAEAKAWAAKTLPTLQEHLKLARGIQAKVAGTAKTEGTPAKK
jgi:putative membrane protein